MKKILIVEDEKEMVTGLKFNLEARDYAVIAAYDGDEGYQKALEEQPDLVILDLMLPKRNGYEVCKSLKQEIPDIPIIILSARNQESDKVLGLNTGADSYICKTAGTYFWQELIEKINKLIKIQEGV